MNITLYFNHIRLICCLLVVQGYINPWHACSYVLNCISLLYIVNNPHCFPYMRKIYMHMVYHTFPTFYQSFPWPFSQCFCYSRFILRWISLITIYGEWWLAPFICLVHITFLLINPRSLEDWSSFTLIIKALGSLYCFPPTSWAHHTITYH